MTALESIRYNERSNLKFTHPLTPSAREGESVALPRKGEGKQDDCNFAKEGEIYRHCKVNNKFMAIRPPPRRHCENRKAIRGNICLSLLLSVAKQSKKTFKISYRILLQNHANLKSVKILKLKSIIFKHKWRNF